MNDPESPPPRGRPRGFDRSDALDAAMDVFWERGYEGSSISDLAAAMGIRSSSLYAAFTSKEALFREAAARYSGIEGAITTRALAEEPTARAAVDAMLRGHARAYADPKTPRGCLITLGATARTPGSEEVWDFLRGKRLDTARKVKRRLDRAADEGDLPSGTDTKALAAYVNTVLEGLSMQARIGASRKQLDAVVDQAMAGFPGRGSRR